MENAVTIPSADRRRSIVAARSTSLALVELAVVVGVSARSSWCCSPTSR
jgi:hypothetical protein